MELFRDVIIWDIMGCNVFFLAGTLNLGSKIGESPLGSRIDIIPSTTQWELYTTQWELYWEVTIGIYNGL
jgi:hypothetical protein